MTQAVRLPSFVLETFTWLYCSYGAIHLGEAYQEASINPALL